MEGAVNASKFIAIANSMNSCVINPQGQYYALLKTVFSTEYEDTYWAEDVMFMERNSRDFVSRAERINVNAEAICDVLRASPQGRACEEPPTIGLALSR